MAINDFVTWARGVFPNIVSQADYLADAGNYRTLGFDSGAGNTKSAQFNKAVGQGSFMAAGLCAFIAGEGQDCLDNGDLAGWVTGFQNAINNLLDRLNVPIGGVVPYAGGAVPARFLATGGQLLLKSEYPKLYAVCGDRFNNGAVPDGYFRMLDMRGRMWAGPDNLGGTPAGRLTAATRGGGWNVIGQFGGEIAHLLSLLEAAAHAHNDAIGHYHYPPAIGTNPDAGQLPFIGAFLTTYVDYTGHGPAMPPVDYGADVTGDALSGATVLPTVAAAAAHNNVQPGLGLWFLAKAF